MCFLANSKEKVNLETRFPSFAKGVVSSRDCLLKHWLIDDLVKHTKSKAEAKLHRKHWFPVLAKLQNRKVLCGKKRKGAFCKRGV